jgi:hypothetical protein
MTDASTSQTQHDAIEPFLSYFTSLEIGGQLHKDLAPRDDPSTGLSMFSTSSIPAEEKLITCPASWVITPEKCRVAIEELKPSAKEYGVDGWKETMLICGYICLHWIYHDRAST